MGSIGAGPQGGIKFISPSYISFSDSVTLSVVDLNTNTALEFPGTVGQQTTVFNYSTFSFQFTLVGGTTGSTQQLFPNSQNTNYDQSQTYRVNDLSPVGCTLVAQPLIPTKSSRFNKFLLTETVTGNNFQFLLSYSPFFPINPTIQLLAPQVVAFPLIITTTNLMVEKNNRPLGYQLTTHYPVYNTNTFSTLFGAGVLDDLLPHSYMRFNGQQVIRVTNNVTGFQFAFEIDFGINTQASYYNFTDPTCEAKLIHTLYGCTITTPVIPNNYSAYSVVVFTVTGTDGRSYQFTIQPNPAEAIAPTITLIGPALGAATLNVDLLTKTFATI
ncbi:MAG: hypothetical protein JST07_11200 [Bacteroidetes bacterium]|nr:hypothetical protein [Bacteroidota bacterium]